MFFACHSSINSSRILLPYTTESVACKIQAEADKTLIVLTVYRPSNRDEVYMQILCKLIEDLYIKYKEAIFWITGDFNLPNIDWDLLSVTDNAYPLNICNLLIDAINLGGFSQLVDTPTRGNNILDLFATNRPSLVNKVKVSPGISDHEVICVESVLTATVAETIPRKVYLWHKANMQLINDKVVDFCKAFTSHYSISTSIQDLWESF